MRWRWIFLIGLLIFVALATFLFRQARSEGIFASTVLVLDKADRPGLPGNFRMTQRDLPQGSPVAQANPNGNDMPARGNPDGNGAPVRPDLQGLAALNASGSSQFAAQGLQSVRQAIGPGFEVTVVDLRQESHGFVNGMAVSWYGRDNEANMGLTKAEVLADETRKLNDLARQETVVIHRGHAGRSAVPLKVTAPFTVRSEEQLARDTGLGYYRIPVTDHHRPGDAAVDDFVQFVKQLSPKTWLHFHCRAGVGRTTTFMIMYDMMRNAKQVAFNDIIQRQLLLGGVNIIRHYDRKNPGNPNTRAINEFLQHFYCYCQTNRDNFETSWSQWLQTELSDEDSSSGDEDTMPDDEAALSGDAAASPIGRPLRI